jgi:ATP-dependent helicase IRC3
MGSIAASGTADITVASVSSIISGDRLLKYDPARFKLVLVDEAHHIVAPTYLKVLKYFGLYPEQPECPALVGVSATFSRLDGVSLGAAVDHIVYHKDYVDMIDERWLTGVRFTTVESRADLSKVSRSPSTGDFNTRSLSKAVSTEQTNNIILKAWLSEARERKSTLIFCVDIAHVESLTYTFRRHGIDARYITGATKTKQRQEQLESFKSGDFPVLLNCAIFTEGTDIPNIDCVVLARPTRSRNLLVQMIGRGMRLHPGKEDCHVIDMVASLETGIVTVPTLFGLDPSEMIKDASAEDLKALKQERDAAPPSHDIATRPDRSANTILDFTHYDTVHDLIEDTSGERHVRALSPNAWVQVAADKYMLCPKNGILTITNSTTSLPSQNPKTSQNAIPTEGATDPFTVTYKYPLPPTVKSKAPYSAPRVIGTASTLSAALNAGDTFAASKFERIWIATSSSWRKGPASEQQLQFLNNLRSVSEEEPLTPADLTKGQANDMITKIKYGARGRFDKLMAQKRKVKKEKERWEREQELREREVVKVGRLEA